jgi:hypothetical protein
VDLDHWIQKDTWQRPTYFKGKVLQKKEEISVEVNSKGWSLKEITTIGCGRVVVSGKFIDSEIGKKGARCLQKFRSAESRRGLAEVIARGHVKKIMGLCKMICGASRVPKS